MADEIAAQEGSQGAPARARSWRSTLATAGLAVGIVLAAFTGLARVPLCEPAEGLNGDIARTMIESGDWVVPHHNGCDYVDKPPLFYWVTSVGLRLFGDSELGARFGVALVGLCEVALVLALGSLLYGRTAGLLAAAALATSVGHLVFARLMMVDTLFSTCLTATLLCFALGCVKERRRLLWWTLAGVAAGLAVLTKSLIGVVLPAIVVGLFVVTTRRWRLLRQPAILGALLGFLAVALPWHVAMSLRVPGFAQQYFWNEQVQRFLGHREPVDYSGVPLPAFLSSPLVWAIPWGFFLPQMIWSFRRRQQHAGDLAAQLAARLPWLWLGTVIGFFALAQGRLFYYSLPSLPAFALLAGSFWSEVGRHGERFRSTLAVTVLAGALTAPPAILMLRTFGAQAIPGAILRQLIPPTIAVGICVVLGCVVATLALLRGRQRLAFVALCCGVLASVVPITGMFGAFARYVSLGTLVKSVRLAPGPEDVVVHRFVRDDNSELPFYLHHRVRILKRPGELHQPIAGNAAGYYIEQDEFERLWRSGRPVFLLVSQPDMPEQRPEPLPPHAVVLARDLDASISCNPAAARRLAAAGRGAAAGGAVSVAATEQQGAETVSRR